MTTLKTGQFPLPPGRMAVTTATGANVDDPTLTPYEREALARGVLPSDETPEAISREASRMQALFDEELAAQLAQYTGSGVVVAPPPPVHASQLPPAAQQAFVSAAQAYAAPAAPAAPALPAAQAAPPVMAAPVPPPQPAPPAQAPAPPAHDSVQPGAVLPKAVQQPAAGGAVAKPPEPTESDKLGFLAAVLEPTARFRKAYPLFGGRLTPEFQTLTVEEVAAVEAKVTAEVLAGEHKTASAAKALAQDYLAALSLARLDREGRQPMQLWSYAQAREQAKDDALPGLLRAAEAVCGSVHAYQAVRRAWAEFWALVKELERRGSDPGFWTAAENGAS
jgi:hypothetical protein